MMRMPRALGQHQQEPVLHPGSAMPFLYMPGTGKYRRLHMQAPAGHSLLA